MKVRHPIASLALLLNEWSPDAPVEVQVARLDGWMNTLPPQEQAAALALLYKGARKRKLTLAIIQEEVLTQSGCPSWLWQTCVDQARDLTEACALLMPVVENGTSTSSLAICFQILVTTYGKTVQLDPNLWMEVYQQLDVPGRYYWLRMLQGGFKTKISPAAISAWIQKTTGATAWQASRILEDVELSNSLTLEALLHRYQEGQLHPVPFPELRTCTLDTIAALETAIALVCIPLLTGQWVQWQRQGDVWALWDANGLDLSARFPMLQNLVPASLGNVHFTARWVPAGIKGQELLEVLDIHAWDSHPVNQMLLSERHALAVEFCKACGTLGPVIGDALLYKSPPVLSGALKQNLDAWTKRPLLIRSNALPGMVEYYLLATPRIQMKGVLLYTQWEQKEGVNYQWLTLGMWNGTQWVTVCKVNNNLEVPYLSMLQAWIKKNRTEKAGPVHMVRPEQVMQFSCSTVVPSKRHKCGYQLVDPVLENWLRTESAEAIPQLEEQLQNFENYS